MDSHIQLPKVVIKQFNDNNNLVYYYDFNFKRVKRGHAKTLYTEEDYYSENAEKSLCSELETKLGKLIKNIRETKFIEDVLLTAQDKETVFLYLYSLNSRSPSFHQKTYTYFDELLKVQEKHDYIALHGMELLKENKLLDNIYQAGVIDNISNLDFVLPANGIVQFCKESLFCPLTPKRGIIFEPAIGKADDTATPPLKVDEDFVLNLNIMAIEQERKREKRYVIARDKEMLQFLINQMDRCQNK